MSLPIQPLGFANKLTKRYFINLPDGVYLVSCIGNPLGGPAFAELVLPRNKREEQWKRIKEARCDGRNCATFRSKEHYQGCLKPSVVVSVPPRE